MRNKSSFGLSFSFRGVPVLRDRYDIDDADKKQAYCGPVRMPSDHITEEMRLGLKLAKHEAKSRGMSLEKYLALPQDERNY